jgi:hypothetical protein
MTIKAIIAKKEEKKVINPKFPEGITKKKVKKEEDQMNHMQYWIVNLKNSLKAENSLEFLKTIMECAE